MRHGYEFWFLSSAAHQFPANLVDGHDGRVCDDWPSEPGWILCLGAVLQKAAVNVLQSRNCT